MLVCILQNQCSASYHRSIKEITYMGTLNKFTTPCEWVDTCKFVLSALIRHFCEKSTIAGTALALKDAFAPTICKHTGNSGLCDFLENYLVILAKFSSSCLYMFSFSYFFVVFILWSKTYTLIYETPTVYLCKNFRRTCPHLGAESQRKPLNVN